MINWASLDLTYVEYSFVKSARKKYYTKIWFLDGHTKRKIPVYDFSGLDSAALTFEHFSKEAGVRSKEAGVRWWVSGVINTVGEQHFLVLQQFALVENGKTINPYTMEEGFAEVELVR
jgi:hypothetical protein